MKEGAHQVDFLPPLMEDASGQPPAALRPIRVVKHFNDADGVSRLIRIEYVFSDEP